MHSLIVYSRVRLIHQNDTKRFPEKQEIHSIYSQLTDASHLLAHYVSIKLHATWISLPFEAINKHSEQITRDIVLIILHDSQLEFNIAYALLYIHNGSSTKSAF